MMSSGITVDTQTFNLEIGAGNGMQQRAFFEALEKAAEDCEFVRSANRYDSFAPARPAYDPRGKLRNYCTHLVDAEETYKAMYEAIEVAKDEIFIAGWWVTPELFLLRDPLDETHRLDRLLEAKANEGVQVGLGSADLLLAWIRFG